MARRYPPEFRRRVLDLIASGRKVSDVARDLGVSGQTIYNWRAQDLIDRGERPGLRSEELAELVAARHRIAALEAELAATKRGRELLKEAVPPKGRFEATARMVREGHSVQVTCRVLAVSESGVYSRRGRAPSERSSRHAWLTDLINPGPRPVQGNLRRSAGPGRADDGTRRPGRPQRSGHADAPSRAEGPAREQAAPVAAGGADRRGSGGPGVRPNRTG